MLAYDSSSSDESIDLEYIESLRRHRFRRSTDTYHYSGDVKTDITQNDPLDMKKQRVPSPNLVPDDEELAFGLRGRIALRLDTCSET
jgi:hypothetical protein